MSAEKEDKALQRILSSFSCIQDHDIENFLWNRAVEFERLSKARTYLVCDEEQLQSTSGNDDLRIYGYIALALKVLSVPDSMSNRMRKELDGFSAKIHGEQIKDFPCYLIGQLSKNSNIETDFITGKELLGFANDVVAASVDAVGGRYIMAECHDTPKLISFYEQNGFTEIAKIPDDERPMVQMIRKIN